MILKKSLLLFIVLLYMVPGYINAQKPLEKISYRLFNDFETGELFGWEPYPYAEDIGSNRLYFCQKSPTYKNSRYSLAVLQRANDAVELYSGFTRRLNMWTTTATRLRAAIYFQGDRNAAWVEISLGTFDGRRYVDTIFNPKANHWLQLDIPINDLRQNRVCLKPAEHIQVVTFKAVYPSVYWLNTYTMLMDNFSINGERERRFKGVRPVSTDLDMFDMSILNKHFFYGDSIALCTVPEGEIDLQAVRGTLIDAAGHIIKDNIFFRKLGNQWVNNAIYQIKEGDPAGQWEIRLIGQSRKGTEVRWGFKFLMPGKPIVGHPRLFFSEAELRRRLETEKSTTAKLILNHALADSGFMGLSIDSIQEGEDKTAENLVGGPYGKYTADFDAAGKWLNPMKALEGIIQEGSFRYAFIKDTLAGQKAKKALLKLCSFSKWNNNWMLDRKFWTYYPVGYVLTHVAYGYDMLYGLLTEPERKLVRSAIMEKGLSLFYRDMVEMNRMPSNITNHIAVLVSGSLLAATAIYGDDPKYPYMEPFVSGIITKAKTFIDRAYHQDGSYVEPKTGYMNMATRAIVELLATLERNFGIDYSTTTNAGNFYKYPLQATDSSCTMQDFGDGNSSYKAFTEIHSEWFVHRTGNPFLYSYIKPYWEAGNGGYMGYLWYRDDITPKSRETLPTSKVFSTQGMVMRSGWKEPSTVISTRVGPNGNHAHLDQGSFQIMTNGEQLLTDAGIGAGGYYKNLEYLVYNIQAIGHNVMLVDHDPESQAPADFNNGISSLHSWPEMITSFAGELADAVRSDLTCVYKNKLESYTRTLLYTKSGPLFLFDQARSKSKEGNTFSWLFHAPQNGPLNSLPNYTGWFDKKDAGTVANKPEEKRSGNNESTFSYEDNRLQINREKARLTLDVVSPVIESTKINDKPTESYITINSKPKLREVNFLAVILPEPRPVSGKYHPLPITRRIEVPGWIGARVDHYNAVDLGFFRTGPGNRADTVGGFITDARCFSASFNEAGKLSKAYFDGKLFKGSGIAIKSSEPLTCAISQGGSQTRIEISSPSHTKLEILLFRGPSRVLLNGSAMTDWIYDQQSSLLTINVIQGRNDILIQ